VDVHKEILKIVVLFGEDVVYAGVNQWECDEDQKEEIDVNVI